MKITIEEAVRLKCEWIERYLDASRRAEDYREWLFFHDETEVCPRLTNKEMFTRIMHPKFGTLVPSF